MCLLISVTFLHYCKSSNIHDRTHITRSGHSRAMVLRGGEAVEAQRGTNFKRQISHEDITSEVHGAPDTADARVFAKADGEHRSLWHDLPLFEVSAKDGKPTGALHFVCEIPKWTRHETVFLPSLPIRLPFTPDLNERF